MSMTVSGQSVCFEAVYISTAMTKFLHSGHGDLHTHLQQMDLNLPFGWGFSEFPPSDRGGLGMLCLTASQILQVMTDIL